MKKLGLTLAVVLGLGLASFAQEGGGLFGRGTSEVRENASDKGGMINSMTSTINTNTTETSPLGSGAALLIGFGAAYMMAKKRK